MKTKQVVVLRKFPGLRTGKYCAQSCHASLAFLTKRGYVTDTAPWLNFKTTLLPKEFGTEVDSWIKNSFKKVVVYVETEEELVAVHQAAIAAGLESHLITDNGTTEFGGVPTVTALGVGPHEESRFEGVTNHLPLF